MSLGINELLSLQKHEIWIHSVEIIPADYILVRMYQVQASYRQSFVSILEKIYYKDIHPTVLIKMVKTNSIHIIAYKKYPIVNLRGLFANRYGSV